MYMLLAVGSVFFLLAFLLRCCRCLYIREGGIELIAVHSGMHVVPSLFSSVFSFLSLFCRDDIIFRSAFFCGGFGFLVLCFCGFRFLVFFFVVSPPPPSLFVFFLVCVFFIRPFFFRGVCAVCSLHLLAPRVPTPLGG